MSLDCVCLLENALRFGVDENGLEDRKRSGRPSTTNVGAILQSAENQPDLSLRKRASEVGTSKDTVHRQLKKHGFKARTGRWIPHELTAFHRQQHVEMCQQLLTRQNNHAFLGQIVTLDETWVHYESGLRKINWLRPGEVARAVSKPNPMGKKSMLIVFWAKIGVVHWELIPRGTGLKSELYCTILDRVQVELNALTAQGKRRGQVILQQDNAPPHRANVMKAHITNTLGWEILPHPPYSPDIAPSDYHLFRSMKNHLRDIRFQNDTQVEEWVSNFFEAKSTSNIYQRGIQKLPGKWQEVINNNGDYIVT